MAKPIIKFRTYRQSSVVGGKIYGVPDLGDTVVPSVTMQEVIDYAKLHNYSAATLEALISQVISSVAELVARDGRPRNLSELLKFEPVIKGTFDNLEQTVTKQKVIVRPRMLKEIKMQLDPSAYSWQNQNDTESPKLISVAPASDLYSEVNLASFTAASRLENGFGWTLAGNRLAPNGWDASCKFAVLLKRGDITYHFESNDNEETEAGVFTRDAYSEATDNTVGIAWTDGGDPKLSNNAWYQGTLRTGVLLTPAAGDVVVFQFTRTTASGDTFTVEKSYTL